MSFPVDDQRSRFVGGYPFEDRLDAAYQKFGLDRLGNIVVGSGSEPCELLLLFAEGREKDDHRLLQRRVAAQGPAGFDAVHRGHHHVEQDQVRPMCRSLLQTFGSVAGRIYFVARLGQVVTDEFEDVVFVVDEQDAMTHKSVRNFCEDNKIIGKSCAGAGKMVIFARFIWFCKP